MAEPAREPAAAVPAWQPLRHATSSVAATAVDYLLMIALVSAVGVPAVPATAVAAFAGGVTSFSLSRNFTFKRRDQAMRRQIVRFALVSGTSLCLNTAGEYLFHVVLGWHYLLARVVTSLLVNGGWNYPMLRFFVFSGRPPSRA